METVNGVTDGDKGGPPPPSPLTGCYLLIIVGEPHSEQHKDIILQRIAKGLLSWDVNDCLVDLEKELAIITEQALEGEEARYGERLIQFASENLVTEILIHPVVSTLAQCMRNLLSSFTRHRHIIHAGYTFAANGSWALQDGTFSLADFSEAFQELEVQRVIRAYENGISLDLHCSPEGDWSRLPKESFTKACKVRVNPTDVLTAGSPSITEFVNYLSPFLVPTSLENLLESSDVVGNIRFSRPTLYVFPGGQGDAALFGINGFNMLLDGGYSRKACFWDFVRHLDRLDAVLMTRLNNSNVGGISSVLRRKRQDALYPQIGHFFCNIQDRKAILSPDGDKDKDPLLINLLDEGQEIISNLRHLNLNPQACYRDSEPINLYHKVGHGTLDMYVLNPAKDSKEVREFIQKWNQSDQKLFANLKPSREFSFPVQNLISIAALLIWQPANPNDTITRILYPGSSPQKKIFEGLDRLKNLEFIKHPVCTEKSLTPISIVRKIPKDTIIERVIPKDRVIMEKRENKIIENNISINGDIKGELKEKMVRKSDSTESDRSSKTKKIEDTKPIESEEKPKAKPKVFKPRSDSQQRKKPSEKKASPTTPKKAVENGDIRKPIKPSPVGTPAKSAKDASNRKVIESKARSARPPTTETKPKIERKPISRRPKGTMKAPISPVKKLVNGVQKPDSISKKGKLDKEGTTDSSTVSTPSADQESLLKKDISKLTPEEIQQLKAQELADLKEEQEAVKEIEAVFRKGEGQLEGGADLRKVKDVSIEDKIEKEEYLIIEKEEIDHDSLEEKETKEDEIQKLARDSEESEKQRKLSDEEKVIEKQEIQEQVREIITEAEDIVKAKEEMVEVSKDTAVISPEEKVDLSSTDKKTDKDAEEGKDVVESHPDEKVSAIKSGDTTTAPTLPEDERIPLDEIKEDNGQVIEEKYVKEETKEKEVPIIQLPPKTFEPITKIPGVVGIRLDKQSHIRDIVKTPDEVADLPVHEEVDYEYTHELKADTKTNEIIEDKKDEKAEEFAKSPEEGYIKEEIKETEQKEGEDEDQIKETTEDLKKTSMMQEELKHLTDVVLQKQVVLEKDILKDSEKITEKDPSKHAVDIQEKGKLDQEKEKISQKDITKEPQKIDRDIEKGTFEDMKLDKEQLTDKDILEKAELETKEKVIEKQEPTKEGTSQIAKLDKESKMPEAKIEKTEGEEPDTVETGGLKEAHEKVQPTKSVEKKEAFGDKEIKIHEVEKTDTEKELQKEKELELADKKVVEKEKVKTEVENQEQVQKEIIEPAKEKKEFKGTKEEEKEEEKGLHEIVETVEKDEKITKFDEDETKKQKELGKEEKPDQEGAETEMIEEKTAIKEEEVKKEIQKEIPKEKELEKKETHEKTEHAKEDREPEKKDVEKEIQFDRDEITIQKTEEVEKKLEKEKAELEATEKEMITKEEEAEKEVEKKISEEEKDIHKEEEPPKKEVGKEEKPDKDETTIQVDAEKELEKGKEIEKEKDESEILSAKETISKETEMKTEIQTGIFEEKPEAKKIDKKSEIAEEDATGQIDAKKEVDSETYKKGDIEMQREVQPSKKDVEKEIKFEVEETAIQKVKDVEKELEKEKELKEESDEEIVDKRRVSKQDVEIEKEIHEEAIPEKIDTEKKDEKEVDVKKEIEETCREEKKTEEKILEKDVQKEIKFDEHKTEPQTVEKKKVAEKEMLVREEAEKEDHKKEMAERKETSEKQPIQKISIVLDEETIKKVEVTDKDKFVDEKIVEEDEVKKEKREEIKEKLKEIELTEKQKPEDQKEEHKTEIIKGAYKAETIQETDVKEDSQIKLETIEIPKEVEVIEEDKHKDEIKVEEQVTKAKQASETKEKIEESKIIEHLEPEGQKIETIKEKEPQVLTRILKGELEVEQEKSEDEKGIAEEKKLEKKEVEVEKTKEPESDEKLLEHEVIEEKQLKDKKDHEEIIEKEKPKEHTIHEVEKQTVKDELQKGEVTEEKLKDIKEKPVDEKELSEKEKADKLVEIGKEQSKAKMEEEEGSKIEKHIETEDIEKTEQEPKEKDEKLDEIKLKEQPKEKLADTETIEGDKFVEEKPEKLEKSKICEPKEEIVDIKKTIERKLSKEDDVAVTAEKSIEKTPDIKKIELEQETEKKEVTGILETKVPLVNGEILKGGEKEVEKEIKTDDAVADAVKIEEIPEKLVKSKESPKFEVEKEETETKLLEKLPSVEEVKSELVKQTEEIIKTTKEDKSHLEKIESKLQQLKDKSPEPATEVIKPKTLEEIIDESEKLVKVTKEDKTHLEKLEAKLQQLKEPEDLKTGVKGGPKETAVSEEQTQKIDEEIDSEEESPKDREKDVIKIVTSVAEVLKSDAPLEEFEGKLPISTYSPYTTAYTTELRETHITTVDSPTVESRVIKTDASIPLIPKEPHAAIASFLEEERKVAPLHEPALEKIEDNRSSLLKESQELMMATSKIISDIKSGKTEEKEDPEEPTTVHRMLVTASSEDGGEETEICPEGTIIFSKSSESSGRSSPDKSQELSKKSSLVDTISDSLSTVKHIKDVHSEKDSGIDDVKSDTELETQEKFSPSATEVTKISLEKSDDIASGKSSPDKDASIKSLASGKSSPDISDLEKSKEIASSLEDLKKSVEVSKKEHETVLVLEQELLSKKVAKVESESDNFTTKVARKDEESAETVPKGEQKPEPALEQEVIKDTEMLPKEPATPEVLQKEGRKKDSLIGEIEDAVKDGLEAVSDFTKSLFSKGEKEVEDVTSSLEQKIVNVKEKSKEAISKTVDKGYETLADLKGAKEGISEKTEEKIKDTLESVSESVSSFLEKGVKKLEETEKSLDIATAAAHALEDIKETADKAEDKVGGVAEKAEKHLESETEILSPAIAAIEQDIQAESNEKQASKDVIDTLTDKTTKLVDSIMTEMTAIAEETKLSKDALTEKIEYSFKSASADASLEGAAEYKKDVPEISEDLTEDKLKDTSKTAVESLSQAATDTVEKVETTEGAKTVEVSKIDDGKLITDKIEDIPKVIEQDILDTTKESIKSDAETSKPLLIEDLKSAVPDTIKAEKISETEKVDKIDAQSATVIQDTRTEEQKKLEDSPAVADKGENKETDTRLEDADKRIDKVIPTSEEMKITERALDKILDITKEVERRDVGTELTKSETTELEDISKPAAEKERDVQESSKISRKLEKSPDFPEKEVCKPTAGTIESTLGADKSDLRATSPTLVSIAEEIKTVTQDKLTEEPSKTEEKDTTSVTTGAVIEVKDEGSDKLKEEHIVGSVKIDPLQGGVKESTPPVVETTQTTKDSILDKLEKTSKSEDSKTLIEDKVIEDPSTPEEKRITSVTIDAVTDVKGTDSDKLKKESEVASLETDPLQEKITELTTPVETKESILDKLERTSKSVVDSVLDITSEKHVPATTEDEKSIRATKETTHFIDISEKSPAEDLKIDKEETGFTLESPVKIFEATEKATGTVEEPTKRKESITEQLEKEVRSTVSAISDFGKSLFDKGEKLIEDSSTKIEHIIEDIKTTGESVIEKVDEDIKSSISSVKHFEESLLGTGDKVVKSPTVSVGSDKDDIADKSEDLIKDDAKFEEVKADTKMDIKDEVKDIIEDELPDSKDKPKSVTKTSESTTDIPSDIKETIPTDFTESTDLAKYETERKTEEKKHTLDVKKDETVADVIEEKLGNSDIKDIKPSAELPEKLTTPSEAKVDVKGIISDKKETKKIPQKDDPSDMISSCEDIQRDLLDKKTDITEHKTEAKKEIEESILDAAEDIPGMKSEDEVPKDIKDKSPDKELSVDSIIKTEIKETTEKDAKGDIKEEKDSGIFESISEVRAYIETDIKDVIAAVKEGINIMQGKEESFGEAPFTSETATDAKVEDDKLSSDLLFKKTAETKAESFAEKKDPKLDEDFKDLRKHTDDLSLRKSAEVVTDSTFTATTAESPLDKTKVKPDAGRPLIKAVEDEKLLKKEVEALEKSAEDLGQTLEYVSDMAKLKAFDKCEKPSAEREIMDEKQLKKDEEVLEKSAEDLEEAFETVSDMSRSIIFDKCEKPSSDADLQEIVPEVLEKEKKLLEKSAEDLKATFDRLSKISTSLPFEKCEKVEDAILHKEEKALEQRAKDVEEMFEAVTDISKSVVFEKCQSVEERGKSIEDEFVERTAEDIKEAFDLVSDMSKSLYFEKCDTKQKEKSESEKKSSDEAPVVDLQAKEGAVKDIIEKVAVDVDTKSISAEIRSPRDLPVSIPIDIKAKDSDIKEIVDKVSTDIDTKSIGAEVKKSPELLVADKKLESHDIASDIKSAVLEKCEKEDMEKVTSESKAQTSEKKEGRDVMSQSILIEDKDLTKETLPSLEEQMIKTDIKTLDSKLTKEILEPKREISTLDIDPVDSKKLSISDVEISMPDVKSSIGDASICPVDASRKLIDTERRLISDEKSEKSDIRDKQKTDSKDIKDTCDKTKDSLLTEKIPVSIAGPSTTHDQTKDLLSRLAATEEEKQKELQETLLHEKHIPGAITPPTAPVSPNVIEPYSEDIKLTTRTEALIKEMGLRSSTPGSDDFEMITSTQSDLSSGQVSKVPLDSEKLDSDEDDQLSVTSQIADSRDSSHYELEDRKIDPMSMSFYGSLPDDPVDTDEKQAEPSYLYEITKAKYSSSGSIGETDQKLDQVHKDKQAEEASSSSVSKDKKEDPIQSWGKPLGLPAPSTYLYEITKARYATQSLCEYSEKSDFNIQEDYSNKRTYLYEVTKAKHSTPLNDEKNFDPDYITQNKHAHTIMSTSFYGDLPSGVDDDKDPIASWGKPLGLPSPAPPNDNKGTPKKERRLPPNVTAKNKLNDDKKRAESPSKKNKKVNPIYLDLTYVPHHGNSYYSYVDFFKKIRARYYVFSGIEPSREVYNALLEAKQTWEDKDLEVTIIPTYDTDILGYWVAENEELLTKYKIDLSPSASRCTINLQDHETSCSAYRLEF